MLQLQGAIVTAEATPVHHCSQVEVRDTPLTIAADLGHKTTEITTTRLIGADSEMIASLTFDVKLRCFTFIGGCMDIAIFNFEVDIFVTAVIVCHYEEWACVYKIVCGA